MKIQLAFLGAMALLSFGGGAAAFDAAANDYAKPETWLCRPDLKTSPCDADQTTTIVKADGTMTTEAFAKAKDPKVDCFYVYPTVSRDPNPNSDMTANDEELRVIAAQFARFGSVCRTFAPLYRQVTLTALGQLLSGGRPNVDRDLGYNDVKAAWNWYLANKNKGRGVVLIGHSQGSGVLARLFKEEIDGKAIQKRIVGLMPIGANIPVNEQGMFGSMPSCSKLGQTGCLVAYVSFRDTVPPPASSRFGKGEGPGTHAACVNPASLAGGAGQAHSYLWSAGRAQSAAEPPAWVAGKTVSTPWVSTPGLITLECVRSGDFSYLKVTTNADPADPRTDSIVGDVMMGTVADANWGLHLIDMNLAMGDLVGIVKAQSAAWK